MGYVVTSFNMQVGDEYLDGLLFKEVIHFKCPEIIEKKLLLLCSTFGGKEFAKQQEVDFSPC